MRIREATAHDIPQMPRIRMSVRENALTDPQSIQPHDYRILLDAGGRGWVAELDDLIVGFDVADLEPPSSGRSSSMRIARVSASGGRAAGWHESRVDASGDVRFEIARPSTAPRA